MHQEDPTIHIVDPGRGTNAHTPLEDLDAVLEELPVVLPGDRLDPINPEPVVDIGEMRVDGPTGPGADG